MASIEEDNVFQSDIEARLETGIGRSTWFELDRRGLLPKAIFIGRKKLRVRREMHEYRASLVRQRDAMSDDF